MFLAVLVGVAIVVFVIMIGGWVAQSQNPPSIDPTRSAPTDNCDQLCADWDKARSQRCMAEASASLAKARFDALMDQRNAFLATAAGATAIAIALLLIPFVGAVFAAAFFAAAAVAAALALGLMGACIAAQNDFLTKKAIAGICLAIEADARNLLIQKCPDKATACLSTPSPC